MYHNDLQIQVSNNSKRNINEHPIGGILTRFFNTNNPMNNLQSNGKSNNQKTDTKLIIQRQKTLRTFLNKQDDSEPSIRKPTTLGTVSKSLSITSISSPHLLFAELNEDSTNNNNNHRQQILKKDTDHLSPILNRRQRPILDNNSSIENVSDISNISGSHLSTTISSNSRSRPSSDRSSFKTDPRLPSPRLKSLHSSKIFYESLPKQNTFISKSNHQTSSLLTHSWLSKHSDQTSNSTRTLASILRPKSHLSKHILHRHPHEKLHHNSRINSILDLYISPRTIPNPHHDYDTKKKLVKPRFIIDECDDSKSTHNGISEENELINTDGNSSISIPQYEYRTSSANHSNRYDLNSSPNFNFKSKMPNLTTKRSFSRKRIYSTPLPPVIEYTGDDDDDDEYH